MAAQDDRRRYGRDKNTLSNSWQGVLSRLGNNYQGEGVPSTVMPVQVKTRFSLMAPALT